MKKELSNDNSKLSRQNILNNSIAINAIKDELRLNTIPFEDKFVLLKEQVASFFEVDSRTINNYISNFNEELTKNGYEVLSHKRLNSIKLAIEDAELPEIDFLKLKTAPQLAIFDFRAFLNIAMLLKDSNRAAEIRSLILDIAINSITSAAGGATTYINQREYGEIKVATSKVKLSLCINNILKCKQLREISLIKEYLTTALDAKRYLISA